MRQVVTLIFLLVATGITQAADNPIELQIRQAYEEGRLEGLHGMLVTLGDRTVAEVYIGGPDERWGQSIGHVEHGPETLHDLRSVTKSVVGLLYGIALADGVVPPPAENLLAQFPEYDDLPSDPRREAMTVADVLTMRMGTEWNENLPYSDPRNSEIAMEFAPDRYRFVLDRPMVAEPGSGWIYNGGATALIARLITKGSGQPIDVYAREKLFAPLGIDRFEWVAGGDGVPSAASGLRLRLRDLARIGQLINRGGIHRGERIVPEAWLRDSFAPKLSLDGGLRYGYHWYLSAAGDPPHWMSGFGNGGQRLTVQPQHDLVLAFFAGNYNRPDAWRLPVTIIEEILAPALQSELQESKAND